ncbi:MAG: TolC family protein [Candidatus Krumholzibacteriota bacterium]|nr:TolC family protein [Candidatus Krumholzibacteriota bacterium]
MTVKLIIYLLFILITVSSCGTGLLKPGIDSHASRLVEIPSTYEGSLADSSSPADFDKWWTVFQDPDIDTLVEDLIERNLDIQVASAVIKEMQARSSQTRSARLPSVSLNGSYQRQLTPEISTPMGISGGEETDSYNLSAAASFELDLWGKLSMADEAARFDLLSSIENRNIIVQGIISEAISIYLQIEALERRIAISEETISRYKNNVEIMTYRYNKGLVSTLELQQSKRNLASAESNLPLLRQELGINQQRLRIITGKYPATSPPKKQPEDYFRTLSPVPEGLPSDLLENRPDIRSAAARLGAAAARVGVARSNLLPRITFTGNYGYASDQLTDLTGPGNLLWNIIAGITQPVFSSGRLTAEKNAAWAKYQQEYVSYAKVILNAFSEVEAALLTREQQIRRREKVIVFLRQARSTQEIAEKRYQRGLISYLTVLDAMQARFIAEQSLVLTDLAIMTNRVALHRALGGSWLEEKE